MHDSLMQRVRANPRDERNARLLFQDYESSSDKDANYSMTYLQLRWLYANEKWEYLNEIAKLYRKAGKMQIAYMCLIVSLDEKPMQPEIFTLAESLGESSIHNISDGLREDSLTVSVIMPTYNRGSEIKASIRSVLNQSYRDFELIVVNDGGADGVKDIISSFSSDKIKYYKLDRNKGLAGALNEGIRRAAGRYIAYLDDDDVYYPKHLETLVGIMEKRPDCDLVYSNAWWCSGEIRDDTYVEKTRKLLGRRPNSYDRDLLFWINYISTLNVLHRKECLRKSGLFNEDLKMLMDWELWLRFALEHKFYQFNGITGEYRFKGNNMSTVDELTMVFLANIIRRYYEVNRGTIVFLKHYLRDDQREKAEKIYFDMLQNHAPYTRSAKKELFYISREFPFWKSRKLYVALSGDYINAKAKRFIKFVTDTVRNKDRYC